MSRMRLSSALTFLALVGAVGCRDDMEAADLTNGSAADASIVSPDPDTVARAEATDLAGSTDVRASYVDVENDAGNATFPDLLERMIDECDFRIHPEPKKGPYCWTEWDTASDLAIRIYSCCPAKYEIEGSCDGKPYKKTGWQAPFEADGFEPFASCPGEGFVGGWKCHNFAEPCYITYPPGATHKLYLRVTDLMGHQATYDFDYVTYACKQCIEPWPP